MHKAFGANQVLRGVTLEVPKGKSMVIIGGIANNWGVVAGAILMQFALAYVPFVKDWFDVPSDFVAATRLIIVGGGILAFLICRPKGIFPERIGGSHV